MAPVATYLLPVSGFVTFAHAYTTFEPECTKPEELFNYVGTPPVRGTLTILWSCLFTIFACTWTLHHLNVPEQREDRDPGWWGNFRWGLKSVLSKSKWMLGTVLAPEIVLFFAVTRNSLARFDHPRLLALAKAQNPPVPWSKTHTTFANMGGFILRGRCPPTTAKSFKAVGSTTQDYQQLDNHELPELGNKLPSAELPRFDYEPHFHEVYHMTAEGLANLCDKKYVQLPSITEAEINDRSKGDAFTKSIAVFQIVWTCIDVITRAIKGLAISQLEISVIAFSACALLTYSFYFNTPKDVRIAITIHKYEGAIPEEVKEEMLVTRYFIDLSTIIQGKRIRNDLISGEGISTMISLFGGSIPFGAPHLLAWNFSFPNPWERTAWRTCSIICTSLGLLMAMLMLIDTAIEELTGRLRRNVNHFSYALSFVVVFGYVAARLFLLVETFRTLLYLPPSAYTATWTSNLPAFG